MNIIRASTGQKAYTVEDAAAMLRKAREAYEMVAAERRGIAHRETTALNALNEAQREFDAAVNDIKADAPPNSDWHSRSNKGVTA